MTITFPDTTRTVRTRDIFRDVKFDSDGSEIKVEVPDTFYHDITDYFMERSYLNGIEAGPFIEPTNDHGLISWLRITHLPVNPTNSESYDLLARWQGVLATLHSWNYRLIFLLLRSKGKTTLMLGTTAYTGNSDSVVYVSSDKAAHQLREAAQGSMPGIGLEPIANDQISNELIPLFSQMTDVGAVTGIPSFREEGKVKILQTLDSLAFGLQDASGKERDYAMLVIADPLPDSEVALLISQHRRLSSKIHSDVKTNLSEGRSVSDAGEVGLGGFGGVQVGGAIGAVAGGILGTILGAPSIGAGIGRQIGTIGGGIGTAKQKRITFGTSSNVSREYLDTYAQYAEELIGKHIQRLNEGRNLGFWNTGVYLLGGPEEIRTTAGILRSVYSGRESYLEPIRIHSFTSDSGARSAISNFELLPLVDRNFAQEASLSGHDVQTEEWHIFGRPYQYVSTPINTAELSLATSLPRRDVPGLRFVKTAVRFASNPASLSSGSVNLGRVVDMGVVQKVAYELDPNILVRHAFITGVTGSGKTTTCKRLLTEIQNRSIPFLVIEPAKDDYVRWAIEQNKSLPKESRIRIFMPGGEKCFPEVEPLSINPFQPAAPKGNHLNLLSRAENFATLMNACLPSDDVVPILIDEVINRVVLKFTAGTDPEWFGPWGGAFPSIDTLLAETLEMMRDKDYDPKVKRNLYEVLKTRFEYLRRGTRGKILNVKRSTDFDTLFSGPAIINISYLAGAKEKALVMSLLLLSLYEYRLALYQNDSSYREDAHNNRLMHLTLIEEAHNVLSAPPAGSRSGDPRVASAELFSNILSEIRGYGEGIAVVDQAPSKMISDVMKNTNLKICHRIVAADDCAAMSATLALRDDQRSLIPSLEVGNAIVCGDMDDAAAWVKISS